MLWPVYGPRPFPWPLAALNLHPESGLLCRFRSDRTFRPQFVHGSLDLAAIESGYLSYLGIGQIALVKQSPGSQYVHRVCPEFLCVAATMATIPALMGSGRLGQALTTAARSGNFPWSMAEQEAETVLDSAVTCWPD